MKQEKSLTRKGRKLLGVSLAFFACFASAGAQTTTFTYQGRLTDSSMVATGTYDFQFAVYDSLTGGLQQPQPSPITVTRSGVNVTNGLFTVQLDFGATAFPGADRYLDISVKKSTDPGYTVLVPRQQLASTPYAIRALNATNADNATNATTASGVSASGGDSVVTAINGGSSTINLGHLPSTLATQTSSNTFSGTNTFSTTPTFSAGLSANGQRITRVGTPTATDDAATKSYVDGLIPTTTAGGDLTGSYPNPSIATTAAAGTHIVGAINASSAFIDTSHVTGDVELAPSAQQITNGTTNDLINVKLVGSNTLGSSGTSDLLSLSASGTYSNTFGTNVTRDQERFRVDNTGGMLALGEIDVGTIPVEGAGARFMWLGYKGATRAGFVDGTQWDDPNTGYYSTAFGNDVRASGDYSFAAGHLSVGANTSSIAMGEFCTASGADSVALGYYAHTNARQGSFVFADRSVVDDGNPATDESFRAAANHSFNVRATGGYWMYTNTALTTGLRLSHVLTGNPAYGSFVWADRSNDTAVTPTAQNQTIFRSSGGYWLYSTSDLSAGVTLPPGGGSWSSLSDRNMKTNIEPVDPREILRSVVALPISTWNYKTQDASVKHIGAMAQDFYAAFSVGDDDKHISNVDPDGVALAAIQGLHEELKDRDEKIDQLRQRLDAQDEALAEQRLQIETLIKSTKERQ